MRKLCAVFLLGAGGARVGVCLHGQGQGAGGAAEPGRPAAAAACHRAGAGAGGAARSGPDLPPPPAPTKPRPSPPRPQPAEAKVRTETGARPPRDDASAAASPAADAADRGRHRGGAHRPRARSSGAKNLLGTVNYNQLSNERKKAYNDAKAFIQQAEDALKQSNYVFAQSLATKAETLAKELAGR